MAKHIVFNRMKHFPSYDSLLKYESGDGKGLFIIKYERNPSLKQYNYVLLVQCQ